MGAIPAFSESFLSQYEIVESLGEGAFGAVFRCRQRHLNREGALKILKTIDLEQVKRFIQREVALLSRLDHPNVLKVLDAGVDRATDGIPIPYVVTELVAGGTLEQLIARERLTLSRALEISIQVAEGLHHAHGAGVVHRDVKPANIFLDRNGLAKVADFGLARPIAEGATLTAAGQVLGTPSYIAPEQVLGHRATPAVDQYAVGVTLFEMVSGKLPFNGSNAIEILTVKVKEDPPRARTFVPHLPGSVDALILRSMARSPGDRFPDLNVFAGEARKILDEGLSAARARQADSTSAATPTLSAATATRSRPPTATVPGPGAPAAPVAPTDLAVLKSSLSVAFTQRYRIDSILGAGAMGMVAKGEQLDLTRSVAIKFPTVTGDSQVARFVREGQLLSKLSHPNLVRVYDVGEDSGHLFIVSEFVPGHTLRSLIRPDGVEVGEAAALVVQLLEGLAHAHEQNVIHRDVKSENILVTADALVKLLDFGLAKSLESTTIITRAGAALGTAAYMSPEAARGDDLDQRADVYSVGIVLYELLTGHLPFRGNAMQVMFQQVNDAVPPITKPEVPEAVRAVVMKALAKSRDGRYPTARDFAAALTQASGLADRTQSYVLSALSRAEISAVGARPADGSVVAGAHRTGRVKRPTGRTALASGQHKATPSGRFEVVPVAKPGVTWPWKTLLVSVALALLGVWALVSRPQERPPQSLVSSPLPPSSPTAKPLPIPSRTPLEPPGFVPLGKNKQDLEECRSERDEAVMVKIPAGEFLMGGTLGDETPVHRVHVDGFWIDKDLVTNARYRRFVIATRCRKPEYSNDSRFNESEQPVVGVSWEDAAAYCRWAGKRLPTEAEFEKAARGGLEQKRYPWGDDDPKGRACYRLDFATGRPKPVGSYPANGFGLHDMAGNVWEWCSDWYGGDYYGKSPSRNPAGPPSGTRRVVRGGSWFYDGVDNLRCANRDYFHPSVRNSNLGFRCVRPMR